MSFQVGDYVVFRDSETKSIQAYGKGPFSVSKVTPTFVYIIKSTWPDQVGGFYHFRFERVNKCPFK